MRKILLYSKIRWAKTDFDHRFYRDFDHLRTKKTIRFTTDSKIKYETKKFLYRTVYFVFYCVSRQTFFKFVDYAAFAARPSVAYEQRRHFWVAVMRTCTWRYVSVVFVFYFSAACPVFAVQAPMCGTFNDYVFVFLSCHRMWILKFVVACNCWCICFLCLHTPLPRPRSWKSGVPL